MDMLRVAENCEFAADVAMQRGWGSTASKLRTAANSIRWQVRWEERHPPAQPVDDGGGDGRDQA